MTSIVGMVVALKAAPEHRYRVIAAAPRDYSSNSNAAGGFLTQPLQLFAYTTWSLLVSAANGDLYVFDATSCRVIDEPSQNREHGKP